MSEGLASDPRRRDADIEVVIPEPTDDAITAIAELLLHLADRSQRDEVAARPPPTTLASAASIPSCCSRSTTALPSPPR
jgi:hypothetical protein